MACPSCVEFCTYIQLCVSITDIRNIKILYVVSVYDICKVRLQGSKEDYNLKKLLSKKKDKKHFIKYLIITC